MVSSIGLFSSNEHFGELPSESIKFLLLPAFLGCLSVKEMKHSREEIIRISLIYFYDFVQRCNEYEITNMKLNKEKIFPDESPIKELTIKPSTYGKNYRPSTEVSIYKKVMFVYIF